MAAGLGENKRPHVTTVSSMYDSRDIIDCHELYTVGNASVPFEKDIDLIGIDGELVRVRAIFDDGGMVNAIDSKIFQFIKKQLSPSQRSSKVLKMANGTLVRSEGTWTGMVVVGGIHTQGTFKIFPSNGAWEALFGKLLLRGFRASHEYIDDTITLEADGHQSIIGNDNTLKVQRLQKTEVAVASISNLEDHISGPPLRLRQVSNIELTRTSEQASVPIPESRMRNIDSAWISSGLGSIQEDIFRCSVEHMHPKRRAGRRKRRERQHQARILQMKGAQQTIGGPMASDNHSAEGIRKHKVAVVPASNPGVPETGAPLKQRQVINTKLNEMIHSHTIQEVETTFSVVQDSAGQNIDDSTPGSEQPEIPVGIAYVSLSLARIFQQKNNSQSQR